MPGSVKPGSGLKSGGSKKTSSQQLSASGKAKVMFEILLLIVSFSGFSLHRDRSNHLSWESVLEQKVTKVGLMDAEEETTIELSNLK